MSDPIQFRLFDSHCHLNLSQFDADRETVIKKMEAKSIAAVCVGVDQKSSKEAVEIARGSTHIYACVGQHPTDTREVFDVEAYRLLISDP